MTVVIKKHLRQASKNEAFKVKSESVASKRANWAKKILEFKKQLTTETESASRNSINNEIVVLMKLIDKTAKFSTTRFRKICRISSRSRGVRLGLSRHIVRKYAAMGYVMGVVRGHDSGRDLQGVHGGRGTAQDHPKSRCGGVIGRVCVQQTEGIRRRYACEDGAG